MGDRQSTGCFPKGAAPKTSGEPSPLRSATLVLWRFSPRSTVNGVFHMETEPSRLWKTSKDDPRPRNSLRTTSGPTVAVHVSHVDAVHAVEPCADRVASPCALRGVCRRASNHAASPCFSDTVSTTSWGCPSRFTSAGVTATPAQGFHDANLWSRPHDDASRAVTSPRVCQPDTSDDEKLQASHDRDRDRPRRKPVATDPGIEPHPLPVSRPVFWKKTSITGPVFAAHCDVEFAVAVEVAEHDVVGASFPKAMWAPDFPV